MVASYVVWEYFLIFSRGTKRDIC